MTRANATRAASAKDGSLQISAGVPSSQQQKRQSNPSMKFVGVALCIMAGVLYLQPREYYSPADGMARENLRDKDSHCLFVVSKLYGNHSASRMNATLNWYKKITLESIRMAARFSGERFDYIGAVVWAEGSYATEALSLKKLGDADVPDIHVDSVEGLNQLFPSILQNKFCDIASMVRIDADDMLSPFAFENIRWAWKNNRCTSTKACAQVAGTKKSTKIVLAPLTDKGQLKCLIASDNNPYFASAGLSVTLPVRILLQHFDDKIVCFGNHVKLFHKLREKMKGLGLQVDSYQLLGHAFLPMTPLSGHFNHSNPFISRFGPLQNCKLSYLVAELGEDLGNIIWNAREAVPNLTVEEWKQNGFVRAIW
eukprot:CAMPEP_0172315868 /NCGR_PEP_ID=MMETSP1058-20130122/26523_1 /TAXON_ID=83371 /ORGANISM="Detonula confervacea, Strain CCMP 353" /LENGTH=367 /DNA_ID=CAMNT_0013030047 /DNA_START=511 /DNA_END=1611 /DNA_ORIENTATION=+